MIILDAIGVTISIMLMSTNRNHSNALWFGTALFGVSMASMFPSILNFAKQTYHVSGSGIGLIMQMGSFGAIVAPLIVVGTSGTSGLFTVLLPMSLTALSLFLTLPSSNVADAVPIADPVPVASVPIAVAGTSAKSRKKKNN